MGEKKIVDKNKTTTTKSDLAPKICVFLTREKAEIGRESMSITSACEFELWLLFWSSE